MKPVNVKRKVVNFLMVSIALLCAIVALIPLFNIFIYLVSKGISSVNLDFFTHLPKPVGEAGGGMANAITGTLLLIALASLWAVPVGVFAGVYLAEFGDHKVATIIRFTADVLTGVPSIVIGVFAYALFVLPMKRFSVLSAVFALGFMMIPSIVRPTEEMVKRVPHTLREAALAVGISRAKMTIYIVLRTAMPGILTAILLALARISGETAPLLFTAFGNRFWNHNLNEPIAALPLQIFSYAIAPYDDWHRQAWAGALVLIMLIFLITLISRLILAAKYRTAH